MSSLCQLRWHACVPGTASLGVFKLDRTPSRRAKRTIALVTRKLPTITVVLMFSMLNHLRALSTGL